MLIAVVTGISAVLIAALFDFVLGWLMDLLDSMNPPWMAPGIRNQREILITISSDERQRSLRGMLMLTCRYLPS